MKTAILLVLCLSMLVLSAAEEPPLNIISQTPDSVSFEFDCKKNIDCMDPGEGYCGKGQVKSMKCTDDVCDVVCQPLNPHRVDEEWITGTYNVAPVKKKVGDTISITLKDSRNQNPLIWDVEVYYGGKWEGALTVLSVYTEQILQGATLVAKTSTDRTGTATFIPDKPGQYYFKTMGKYIKFLVADASGKLFNCSNGVCETGLGEDVYVCPPDCQGGEPPGVGAQPPAQNNTPIVPPPQVCGDGVCSATESQTACPQDCGQPVVTGQGGTSAAGTQTGNQTGQQGAAQGGDNTMLIIIIAAVAAVAVVGLLLFMMKSKGGAPKAPKTAQPKEPVKWTPEGPMKCAKCGAESPPGSAFCQGCGQKLG